MDIEDTVTKDVITFLEQIGIGVFGENLYCGRVPDSKQTQATLWWLSPNGLSLAKQHNLTGEDTFNYAFRLYFRNIKYEEVDKAIFKATRLLTSNHCYSLPHFTTCDINITNSNSNFSIDLENRVIGYIAFEVKVYDLSIKEEPVSS